MIEIVLTLVIAFGIFLVWLTVRTSTQNNVAPKSETLSVKPIYMLKDCYHEGDGRFNLVSYDNGENWQVLKLLENKKPIILGNLENVHPTVMYNHAAWLALNEYVISKGAIKLTDRRGVRLLRACHFDVRLKVD